MPFWSAKEDAEHHNVEEWADFEVVEIPLDVFVEDWLITLDEDGVLVGTNWNAELDGKEIEHQNWRKCTSNPAMAQSSYCAFLFHPPLAFPRQPVLPILYHPSFNTLKHFTAPAFRQRSCIANRSNPCGFSGSTKKISDVSFTVTALAGRSMSTNGSCALTKPGVKTRYSQPQRALSCIRCANPSTCQRLSSL